MELPPDKQIWIDMAIRTGLTQEEGELSYAHYGANDWKRGNGIKIEKWEQVPFLLKYWRNNRQNFQPKTKEKKPVTIEEYFRLSKQKIRESHQEYLESKSTQALLDIKKDNGYLWKLCGWLINEILRNRKQAAENIERK